MEPIQATPNPFDSQQNQQTGRRFSKSRRYNMKDTQKIQMLADALRDCTCILERVTGFEQRLTASKADGGAKLADDIRQSVDGAETVLAMVEDDGAELPATLPEITPTLRAAGAIVAKYDLAAGLPISQACTRIHEIAGIIDQLNTREASTDAS